MAETAEQYKDRLAGYIQGRDPLTIQRETAAILTRLIDGATPHELQHRPAPDKWSVVEILAHLAEDELATSWRYRQMIEHDGQVLSGFDQDLWARIGHYDLWQAEEALQMFRLLREANMRLLDSLLPAHWDSSGIHQERGKLTVRELAAHMASHDVNHIKQIERILKPDCNPARP